MMTAVLIPQHDLLTIQATQYISDILTNSRLDNHVYFLHPMIKT